MNFKAILKSIAFLIILFVMLYVGLNNRDTINFSFPIAEIRISAPAAIIFFGVFAVGVFAGMLLHLGGGGGGKKGGAKDK